MNLNVFAEATIAHAHTLGFDLAGIAPVANHPEAAFYTEWLGRGYAGEMAYLHRHAEKRDNPDLVLPGVRSAVVCAVNYNTDLPYSTDCPVPDRGWISRYAWGDDYHDVVKEMLLQLRAWMAEHGPCPFESRVYVDTGPVSDRILARHAGLGWFGKNTCIINQDLGSWLFLGEVLCTLDLPLDVLAPDRCGTCKRCIDACPTKALVAPYVLDSRRCISYLSIEQRGGIDESLRPGMGAHVFGCDICQDVCPWNRKPSATSNPHFQPREGAFHPPIADILRAPEEEFRTRFRKSPVKRAKWEGVLRNAAIAAGNSGDVTLIPDLRHALGRTPGIARDVILWAIHRLQHGPGGKRDKSEVG